MAERWTRVTGSLAAGCGLLLALSGSARAQAGLSAEEIELRVLIEERQPELERTLENWVNQNTGSLNLEGLRGFAAVLEAELLGLDFEVRVEPGAKLELPGQPELESGPLVIATRRGADAGPSALRLLLIGHYDTVYEPDSPFQRFVRQSGTGGSGMRAIGPGVTDMKGGLLVMLTALRALHESGGLERANVTVLLNADEELGSLGSRARIEAAAREADLGFVFESAQQGGAMVRSRGGLGQFHLTVKGVAAHAGSAHQSGRSAIRELATKVLAIEALTDYTRGLTLNVGTIRGGSKRNIVPEEAEAWIDLRYAEPEDGERTRGALERIAGQSTVPDTHSALWGQLHRPPKLADARVDALLAAHAEVAKALGIELPPPVTSGGGTDGSLTAAVGLTTLDSVGVVGGGAHTDEEFVELASLGERSALAAALLSRLIRTHPVRGAARPGTESGVAAKPGPGAPSRGTTDASRGATDASRGATDASRGASDAPRNPTDTRRSGAPARAESAERSGQAGERGQRPPADERPAPDEEPSAEHDTRARPGSARSDEPRAEESRPEDERREDPSGEPPRRGAERGEGTRSEEAARGAAQSPERDVPRPPLDPTDPKQSPLRSLGRAVDSAR